MGDVSPPQHYRPAGLMHPEGGEEPFVYGYGAYESPRREPVPQWEIDKVLFGAKLSGRGRARRGRSRPIMRSQTVNKASR